jgi:hypothetical protein
VGLVALAPAAHAAGSAAPRHTLPNSTPDWAKPAAQVGTVASSAGLDGSDRLMKPTAGPGAPPSPAFVNAPPCSTSWGQKLATDKPPAYGETQPYAPCRDTPSQLEGAYGVNGAIAGGVNGRGQTVAIVDAFASPTIEKDADQYARLHGQPRVPFRQIVPPGIFNVPEDEPTGCDPQDWYGDETLDVEAVHAMAPAANVLYVGGQDCLDESLIDAVNKIVGGDRAQIISNSYGGVGEDEPVGLLQAWNGPARLAPVRRRRRHQPDLRRARLPEAGRAARAGARQRRRAAPRRARRQPRRRPQHGDARRPDPDVPRREREVSEYRIGGTSLSSPLTAGVMALSDQLARTRHGFANPALYAQAGTAAYRDVVAPVRPIADVRNDFVNGVDASDGITTSLRTFDQTQTLATTAGYDDVTGVGSPHGQAFLSALAFGAR